MFMIDLPILTYHQITPGPPPQNLKFAVSVIQFERQMTYLHKNGYKCVPLTEFSKNTNIRRVRRRRTVALTFDDGYENFYSVAFPILQSFGFTATVFVITNRIRERINQECNADNRFLAWEQIKALRQNGISFGSHCCSHPRLPDLSREKIQSELVVSKEILETGLGEKTQWLAYPYSASTPEIQKMAENAGYMAAFGGSRGISDRFNIWRRACQRDDKFATFILRLNRWYHYPGYLRENTMPGKILRRIKHRFDF